MCVPTVSFSPSSFPKFAILLALLGLVLFAVCAEAKKLKHGHGHHRNHTKIHRHRHTTTTMEPSSESGDGSGMDDSGSGNGTTGPDAGVSEPAGNSSGSNETDEYGTTAGYRSSDENGSDEPEYRTTLGYGTPSPYYRHRHTTGGYGRSRHHGYHTRYPHRRTTTEDESGSGSESEYPTTPDWASSDSSDNNDTINASSSPGKLCDIFGMNCLPNGTMMSATPGNASDDDDESTPMPENMNITSTDSDESSASTGYLEEGCLPFDIRCIERRDGITFPRGGNASSNVSGSGSHNGTTAMPMNITMSANNGSTEKGCYFWDTRCINGTTLMSHGNASGSGSRAGTSAMPNITTMSAANGTSAGGGHGSSAPNGSFTTITTTPSTTSFRLTPRNSSSIPDRSGSGGASGNGTASRAAGTTPMTTTPAPTPTSMAKNNAGGGHH